MPRVVPRIVFATFDGCQSLDVAGPAEVFAAANHYLGRRAYDVIVGSLRGGLVDTTAAFRIETRSLARVRVRRADTILVVGGDSAAVRTAAADPALTAWLARVGRIAGRIGSVCTGAFVLAASGVLDGHRVATHWAACARLAAARPAVSVDREAIYVADGRLWTSAGVTAGIDMALAMVEADHGRNIADAIASELVLYTRRMGFQSQWSDALVAQVEGDDALAKAITWARGHLVGLDVPRLARQAAMSVRSLHRSCNAQLRITPAKLIEQLRVEHARALLAAGRQQAKAIARLAGFEAPARMTRAFRRALGVRPCDYRMLFRTTGERPVTRIRRATT